MITRPKRAWLDNKSPDLMGLGNANKEMMTFYHMSQVCEEVFVRKYTIKTKTKL